MRRFLYIILLMGCFACSDKNTNSNGSDDSDCVNGDTYHINNGMACNNTPTAASIYQLQTVGDQVAITFNYVPEHKVLGNVSANQRTFYITANPDVATTITQVANTSFTGNSGYIAYIFGIAKTGVPFDPVANEPWVNTANGAKNYEWNLEVLSANAGLVYDCNNAHDPSRYHYHGSPLQYLSTIEDGSAHSGLLGYAADGFPIYYKYGYQNTADSGSAIVALTSSYRIKEGCRPGNGISAPDRAYDGTYVADYEYVEGLGDLDACNGRFAVTPEFPEGTYVYYITDEFPSVPRCFAGTPSDDFKINIP